MIAVDASAIVAMLVGEPEAESFFEQLAGADAWLSPVGYWEAAVNAEQHRGSRGRAELDALLADLGIRIREADRQTAAEAVSAALRFGKHTSARLNLGDCFAYAMAKQLGAPLLYKGADFANTDIESAG